MRELELEKKAVKDSIKAAVVEYMKAGDKLSSVEEVRKKLLNDH